MGCGNGVYSRMLAGGGGGLGARLYGMVNVDAAGPLDALLTGAGPHGVDIDTGWGLPLKRYSGFDDQPARGGVSRKARQNLGRDLRKADAAGVTARTTDAGGPDLDTFVSLARTTAAKYDNADHSSALALTDDFRFHYGAVGYAQEDTPGYSPFYVSYAHVMREAWASGRSRVELGRRNPTFKRRYGPEPRTLRAYVADVAVVAAVADL